MMIHVESHVSFCSHFIERLHCTTSYLPLKWKLHIFMIINIGTINSSKRVAPLNA